MTVQPLGGRGWWWWWRVKEEGEGALNYNIQISTELSAITGTAYVSGDGGRQPRPLTGGRLASLQVIPTASPRQPRLVFMSVSPRE